jgi:hypothetical protein
MIPSDEVDLFDDEALAEPYEHHRRLRHLGPVVRVSARDITP